MLWSGVTLGGLSSMPSLEMTMSQARDDFYALAAHDFEPGLPAPDPEWTRYENHDVEETNRRWQALHGSTGTLNGVRVRVISDHDLNTCCERCAFSDHLSCVRAVFLEEECQQFGQTCGKSFDPRFPNIIRIYEKV